MYNAIVCMYRSTPQSLKPCHYLLYLIAAETCDQKMISPRKKHSESLTQYPIYIVTEVYMTDRVCVMIHLDSGLNSVDDVSCLVE